MNSWILVIKTVLSLGLTTGAYFYWEHLKSFQAKYATESVLHQEAANALLAERITNASIREDAEKLGVKLDEISKENKKYRNCIADGSCTVGLRKPTQAGKDVQTGDSKTGCSSYGETERIEQSVQQDIYDLRSSIRKDELIINDLQEFIIKYCKI